jgi:uncharacterized FlaG/YvyC family protein
MNIKGIVGNLIPIDLGKRDLRKTRNEPDRDAQQGNQGGGEPPKHHRFTEEELQAALKMLKEIPGMKENNLQFRVERNNDRIVIFVEDPTGKVIRRIPDLELWALYTSRQKDSSRGNLLNKAL